MTSSHFEESMQRLAASCCATEQLEGFAQRTLGPVTTSFVAEHLDSGCELCRARLAVFMQEEPVEKPREERAAGLWSQITAGVSRLIEPVALTVSEHAFRIHSGLTPVLAASTFHSQDAAIAGHAELSLGGGHVVDVEARRAIDGAAIALQLTVRQPLRIQVSIEDEQRVCHAELILSSTLEIELVGGSWIVRLHASETSEERELPISISIA